MESNTYLIPNTNIKIIFIKDINNLIIDFFNTIGHSDMKIYFTNENVNINTNFNNLITKNLSNIQIDFLKYNIKFSKDCLDKLNSELLNKNVKLDYDSWKLCIFSEMFFNLPFTLADIIFIPESYINTSIGNSSIFDSFINLNQINKSFSKTLIHEKIHLLQRYNQEIWDNYIIKKTNWIIIHKEIYFNSTLINNNKYIYNPDTFYVKNTFAYPVSGINYYGEMLLKSNKSIKDIWFQMVDSDNKINLYPISYSIQKYEHPYEELAYLISNELIKN
jgi:hypothetical protein